MLEHLAWTATVKASGRTRLTEQTEYRDGHVRRTYTVARLMDHRRVCFAPTATGGRIWATRELRWTFDDLDKALAAYARESLVDA